MAVDSIIGADIYSLPEDCIAAALSLTTPRDACRLMLVASNFRSAAQFDAVWERFLPLDHRDLVSRAVNSADLLALASKKDLYFYLCDHHIIIDDGTKSFSLEKGSGKKCYMLGAKSLQIVWGNDPRYWKWIHASESSFSDAVELLDVCWFEIHGKINTKMLSPDTNYAAYLVFTARPGITGFESQPVEVSVRIGEREATTRTVYLDPYLDPKGRMLPRRRALRIGPFLNRTLQNANAAAPENNGECPKKRDDAWMEVELGEIFVRDGEEEDECIDISLKEVKGGHWKSGIIVLGIEIRPKWSK
ncbi:PREDICTED: putative F-box protein PP2-B12 [Ipomoea nil]|uniref:putative F-box protein PP2-B12 n=1 Tax=Ipomoea nil TaxID=35883 RepID=UPI000901F1C8|nr:PREDICTED: putative F-box protein PP2-B12 [Ipomoea nil]